MAFELSGSRSGLLGRAGSALCSGLDPERAARRMPKLRGAAMAQAFPSMTQPLSQGKLAMRSLLSSSDLRSLLGIQRPQPASATSEVPFTTLVSILSAERPRQGDFMLYPNTDNPLQN